MIVVYRYGLLDPLNWAPDCHSHLTLQCELWNELVDIENDFRDEYSRLIYSVAPALQDLDKKISILLKDAPGSRPLLDVLKLASSQRAEAKKQVSSQVRALDLERWERVKTARSASGLWWSNYNSVVSQYEASRIQVMRRNARLKKKTFSGEGSFHIQVQGGTLVSDFMDGRYLLASIDPVDEEGFESEVRAERKRAFRTSFKATIYTLGNGRDRRQLEFPMVYHRSMPLKAVIKSIAICKRIVCGKDRWTALFTLEIPDSNSSMLVSPPVAAPIEKADAVGIDFGWRVTSFGIRVAVWTGSDGKTGEILLPQRWMERMRWSQGLAKKCLRAREALATEIRSAAIMNVPTWIGQEPLDHLLSAPSLDSTLGLWKKSQPDWRPDLLAKSEFTLRALKKDAFESTNLRKKLTNERTSIYAKAARSLALAYKKIGVEKLDLRKIAKAMEMDSTTPSQVHLHRQWAAITDLKHWLEHQGLKHRCDVLSINASNTTSTCNRCGSLNKGSLKRSVWVTCASCGEKWDQDFNASVNILKLSGIKNEK